MRTSATGIAEPRWVRVLARAHSRGRRSGFTLVELLVVLVIIGLLSGAVILSLPGSRGALLADAEEFAARTKAMRDKAIVDASATSVRVTALGYAFDRRTAEGWKPVSGDVTVGLLWRDGTQALVPAGETIRITFDSTGIAEPAEVRLQRSGRQASVTIGYDGKIDVAG